MTARSLPCKRPEAIARVQAAILWSPVPLRHRSTSLPIAGDTHIDATTAQHVITETGSTENRMSRPPRLSPTAGNYHGSIRLATLAHRQNRWCDLRLARWRCGRRRRLRDGSSHQTQLYPAVQHDAHNYGDRSWRVFFGNGIGTVRPLFKGMGFVALIGHPISPSRRRRSRGRPS
jgi:hypothetical protein